MKAVVYRTDGRRERDTEIPERCSGMTAELRVLAGPVIQRRKKG
jgi:hypothetical protein